MSEETAKIRDKFKNCLLSSLGANGNKGYNVKEFCRLFSEDWYENIVDYAHRLGFSTQNPANDILNLLKSFPEQVIINELPDGSVHLRPVATDDIKENMALIDKTNREMDKIKYIRENRAKQRNQMNLPNPNMIPVQNQQPPAIRLAQIPPHLQSIPIAMAPPPGFHQIPPPPPQPQFPPSSAWAIICGQQQIPLPPPPGQQPRFLSMPPAPRQPQQQQLRPVYQRNQPPPPSVKAQPRSMPPPPNLPGGSKNANLVPLGQVRRPFVGNKFSGQELIDIYLQQQQRSSNSSKQNGHVPASNQNKNARPVVNDFGDVVAPPPKAKNKIEINIRQQPAAASSSSSNDQQPKMMNGHIGESKNWTEDFRVPPSNEASGKGSLVGSRERIDIWAEPSDFEDEDEDEVDGEEMYFDDESEWECPLEMDREWAEDNEECTAFIDEMQQWAPSSIPPDLYRLIHLFRLNDGVYSSAKMEKLQTAYSNAFRADLTTKEWNRLLGSEETIKIVKDRFKRCKWPASEMFKIAEKEKTYSYEIRLLRALTDAVADPAVFVGKKAPSSSASAAPTPSSSRPRSQVQPSPISSIVGGGGAHQMQSPTTSGRNSSSIPPPPSSLPSPIPSTNGGQGPSTTNSKDFDQFAELAIFAQQLLFKAKNGPRKPLNQLFGRIKAMAHPQQFSEILLETQTAFLGYLRLFIESFRIEFQGDGIFVTAMNVQPNSQNCTFPTDSSLFYNNSDLHRGERHKVIMVDYKSPDVCVTLQLSQIFKNLQQLLSEYKQILEDIREPPFENCLPNQRVFFLDAANKSLCRGQFIRHDGEERTIIRDIDSGRERYILRKHIFQLPNNFPNWRFPSCHFSAKFVDVDEAKLKQLWSQANCEFTVDTVEVLPNFCRVQLAADQ